MLSVVIPTLNAEEGLARTLASLVPAAADGLVREVMIADGGSRDGTASVAEAAGCGFVAAGPRWADQVTAGIAAARRSPWLAILSPYAALTGDWIVEVAGFVERTERAGQGERRAATFRLEIDDFGARARLAQVGFGLTRAALGQPATEQGLILSRRHWERLSRAPIGGHAELIRRIGRGQVHGLRAAALALSPDAGGVALASARTLLAHGRAALGGRERR